jgi:hypothetical protein
LPRRSQFEPATPFTTPNIFDLLLTLLCGVFVDPSRFPLYLALSEALPLRHGVEFALLAVAGQGAAWKLIGIEVALGVAWGLAGYVFLQGMLVSARRRGTLQLM